MVVVAVYGDSCCWCGLDAVELWWPTGDCACCSSGEEGETLLWEFGECIETGETPAAPAMPMGICQCPEGL